MIHFGSHAAHLRSRHGEEDPPTLIKALMLLKLVVLLGALIWVATATCGDALAQARPSAAHADAGVCAPGVACRAPGASSAASSVAAPPVAAFDVYVFDVGTGLSVFVAGEDFTLLFDAGSNDDVATGERNRVLAYLDAVRPEMKRIDHLLLSHPHKDHVSLMPDVLERYEVGAFYDSGAFNPICDYQAVLELVQKKDIPWFVPNPTAEPIHLKACGKAHPARDLTMTTVGVGFKSGAVAHLGRDAVMEVLRADGTDYGPDHYNWNSLVVRLVLGTATSNVRVLLTGDEEAGPRALPSAAEAAKAPEAQLLAAGAALAADVVVVPHHGSETSSRAPFIAAVHPRLAIISAGPHPYSGTVLPDAPVVAAWAKAAQVLRTDDQDANCRAAAAKVGPDDDGSPGGCSAVHLHLSGSSITTTRQPSAD